MAKLEVKFPTRFIKDLEGIFKGLDGLCSEMVQAGGQVVYNNVMKNMPDVLKKSNFSHCIRLTKTYKTPTDGAINSKVMVIEGYFINHLGKKTAAPMIANVFEHGRSVESRGGYMPKQPFFRRSFVKKEIFRAMYGVLAKHKLNSKS